MIPILIQNNTPFVWNANDWLKLREEKRIIGNLTGCLVGQPRQETFQGLPLLLLKEEVTLLLEQNAAYVISDTALSKMPDENLKEKYLLYKEENIREQLACYETQRKQQVTLMIDRIIEGKRRKLMGLGTKKQKMTNKEKFKSEETSNNEELEVDREEILKNELNKSTANLSPPVLVQTFSRDPWVEDSEFEKIEWKFPETDQEKLRYSTFKDLWEKGYYITEGHKFGVDYLVYPGDPVKFHAQFLVVCVGYDHIIPAVDLISYARLGSISRKTFVIASKPPNSTDILYQSFQWTERN